MQFSEAVLIGLGHYQLRGLLRGRRGTEWAMTEHAANESFVLLDRTTLAPLDVAAATPKVRVMASGVGDLAGPVECMLLSPGAALLPLSPVHAALEQVADDVIVRWVRRSRLGWAWLDGADAPLAEEFERYRITVAPDVGAPRVIERAEPNLTYSATERTADLAAGAQSIALSIRQLGDHGASRPLQMTISLN